jgi:hypothetical protein
MPNLLSANVGSGLDCIDITSTPCPLLGQTV